jgi:regulator of sigma E protease
MLEFLQNNSLLTGIIAFVFVLIPAVIIHELGHFLAAKSVGITILEFGIGMPPRALRLFRWRGTDYTLNWLPLGGFVRPMGEGVVSQMGDEGTNEDRKEALARGIQNPQSVNETKPLPRIWFMAAGSLANFLMALVLFAIVALLGLPETVGARTNIFYVEPGTPLYEAGLRPGDVIENVNGLNFASSAELAQTLYESRESLTVTVRRAGEPGPLTLTIAPDLSSARPDTTTHPIISFVAPNSPAERAGLQPGDLVLAFDGAPINAFTDLQTRTAANLGREITLTVWRAGETFETQLTPRENPPEGEGAMGVAFPEASAVTLDRTSGLVYGEGLAQQILRPQPITAAVPYAFDQFGVVLRTIADVPRQLLDGSAPADMLRPIGPVGVSQAGAFLLNESVEQNRPGIILNFIALVSISLGLTNLLPIPALDGGRILFVIIEMLRGKPVAPEREGMVHLVGLAILLSLMVLVVFNDLLNPVTEMLR